MSTISRLTGREIFDSRGNPTIEVDVLLSDGARGRAAVPSGASTGATEAVELRDGDPSRLGGLGILRALENVHGTIAPAISGMSAVDQQAVDARLIELDGTPNKARLGANAILGVSMGVARAAANSKGVPLYEHLAFTGGPTTLPVPMLNILNGGRHAEDSTDFQEFMVVPAGFDTFSRALRAGVETYHALRAMLRERGLATGLGDEGGFAPSLSSNREAVELIVAAIERAGYRAFDQCLIALDVAASELLEQDGRYALSRENTVVSREELAASYVELAKEFPIISIEDGMAEEDWDGWTAMTGKLGSTVQIVGDDLYTTNVSRIRKGIGLGASNAVLIKLNQIGTVTETLEVISVTRDAGWGVVISHRSGETVDTTIADLVVGTGAGQIKAGAPARGERTAKYNRLLEIEQELGDRATYAGRAVYEHLLQGR